MARVITALDINAGKQRVSSIYTLIRSNFIYIVNIYILRNIVFIFCSVNNVIFMPEPIVYVQRQSRIITIQGLMRTLDGK